MVQQQALPLTVVQRANRAYVKEVVKCPACVYLMSVLTCMFLLVGWVEDFRNSLSWVEPGRGNGGVMTPVDYEKQWSLSEGDMHYQIDTWLHGRNVTWEQKIYITMFIGKGPLKGKDILTSEVLSELRPLLRKFHTIEVNVTDRGSLNKTYTTWDLCHRLAIPDKPMDQGATGTPPLPGWYLPCIIVSPQNCFEEYLEDAVHPSFQSWDAALKVPWTGKPRFTDPAVNVKAAVFQKQAGSGQKGCDFMVPTTTYTPQIWGGGVTPRPDIADRENLEIEEVKGFKWFIVME